MTRFFTLTVRLFVMSIILVAHAQEQTVQSWLDRAILGKTLTLEETQVFCESRLPRMPQPRSVAEWEREAGRIRRDVLNKVIFRGEAMKWRNAKSGVEWLGEIDGGTGYRIKKLRYEALPGLWIPALLYEPEKLVGKVPVILNVNGHDPNGKAAPYKQIRCINQAKRGMIALNVEWLNMGQLKHDDFNHYKMNQLDLCGTSGLAPFYLAMQHGLDVLLAHPHADRKRVAVTGLSGGAWQTIFISSLDTRVTLANPVAGHSSFFTRIRHFTDLGDSEQTPSDLATMADYHHLNALLAPRPLLLTQNKKDNCCFASDYALPPMLEAAQPIFALYGKPENLGSHINENPGTHNYERDNREAHYRWVGQHFFAGDATFNIQDIPSEGEVKTSEQLAVELPKNNANFHSLALALVEKLPRWSEIPTSRVAAARWRRTNQKKLAEIVRSKTYLISAKQVGQETNGELRATFWKLKVGNDWTVPAVEIVRDEPTATVILVADKGRKSVADEVGRLVAEGKRVIVIDPFYFGECKIAEKDFLFALVVATVGERPLGIQASQLTAVARWLNDERKCGAVSVVGIGPRVSTFVLIAAALEDRAIAGVKLHDSYDSLKEIIQRNITVEQMPELFCFGLLEHFDIKQLTALVAPRPVVLAMPR